MPGAASSSSSPASAKSTARANRAFPHLSSTDTPTLKDVARLVEDGKAKRVIVMAGAGISTAAGMCAHLSLARRAFAAAWDRRADRLVLAVRSPDFRSPGTGLYDNLQRYDLP